MLNKRIILLAYLSLFLLGYIYIQVEYSNLRDKVNKEYIKYKEMSFLLKNYKQEKRKEVDEVFLNQFFKNKGIEVKSISRVEDTFLIDIETLDMIKLTDIIYNIEKLGVEIVQVSAVDNTGKGMYEVRIKLR